MSFTTAIAIFFILWWLVLFAVLPWGVRSQHESDEPMAPGTDPGAPVQHRIGRTIVITTLVTAMLFAVLWAAYAGDWLPVAWLKSIASPPRQW